MKLLFFLMSVPVFLSCTTIDKKGENLKEFNERFPKDSVQFNKGGVTNRYDLRQL